MFFERANRKSIITGSFLRVKFVDQVGDFECACGSEKDGYVGTFHSVELVDVAIRGELPCKIVSHRHEVFVE